MVTVLAQAAEPTARKQPQGGSVYQNRRLGMAQQGTRDIRRIRVAWIEAATHHEGAGMMVRRHLQVVFVEGSPRTHHQRRVVHLQLRHDGVFCEDLGVTRPGTLARKGRERRGTGIGAAAHDKRQLPARVFIRILGRERQKACDIFIGVFLHFLLASSSRGPDAFPVGRSSKMPRTSLKLWDNSWAGLFGFSA